MTWPLASGPARGCWRSAAEAAGTHWRWRRPGRTGAGGGRDALALEAAGLRVRRTDVTGAFVALLRESGHEAEALDPLTDDLGGPYDAVWANASLLHVDRADLPVVLGRLAAATRPGGVLCASWKHGDGEGWSTHGSIELPRMFVYWQEAPLRAALVAAGWGVEDRTTAEGHRGEQWIQVVARRHDVPAGAAAGK